MAEGLAASLSRIHSIPFISQTLEQRRRPEVEHGPVEIHERWLLAGQGGGCAVAASWARRRQQRLRRWWLSVQGGASDQAGGSHSESLGWHADVNLGQFKSLTRVFLFFTIDPSRSLVPHPIP